MIGVELLLMGSTVSTIHLVNWFTIAFIALAAAMLAEGKKLHPVLIFLAIILVAFFAYAYISYNEKRIVPYLNNTYTPVDLKNFGLFENTKDTIWE